MSGITRRQFLGKLAVLGGVGLGVAGGLAGRRWWEGEILSASPPAPPQPPTPWSTEALYYTSVVQEGTLNCSACHGEADPPLPVTYCHTPHAGIYVRCNLCPHRCFIPEGQRGRCRVRENRGGRLFSMVYGNPCAVHVDPIEKKPFYHFLPAAATFSLATAGCNLRCLYCQNWEISQVPPEETKNYDLPPERIVYHALDLGAPVIAYTYTEPIVFYEYMLETARQAREAGLKNVVISAGFINPEPLRALCAAVDAIKIDLKGYDEDFYRKICQAELRPVLEAIRVIHESGIHLEIVNLVVPTLNDRIDQLRALARWLAREVSPDVPLHFTRFSPAYKLTNLPPTPVETLERAREVALEEGMRFVYVGNVWGHSGSHTYCPRCGEAVILREGFAVRAYHIRKGACAYCGEPIPGVWWPEGTSISPTGTSGETSDQ
ncbi:MAG: AmmeMemoRadiSam system radical SAM enzyme [Anaerolineae bacterium]|nr:AmmeMemoRadiSam system radical SAM enzyme [Anaerolineae bacterium]MCX8068724.1 AmmeMemoRadiSam system radical SAM enzyme [Anaerolineae bacterium]MDW7992898.1 AmmeMemoRadiSam system radical SAM enzyme [Anaerolineae bacterium]